MTAQTAIGLAVETAGPGVRLIRVSGRLDRAGVEALARILDAQARCGRIPGHVVVDLAGVNAFDGPATENLGSVVARSRADGVRLHLAGCGGRAELLPLRAREVLQRCSAFPSAEVAVRTLTAARPGAGTVPGPRRTGDGRVADRPAR
ncbi:sodium-independent anion transporter [Pseudonocardia sp. ICBG1293]|uniref:sodium-independent anion transporter n=1 Tax=Pseudonocardia sp. ICBG1293 TaxID=2844382 RepID=UPI001CCA94EC|nr:sodium-independent anion transporter [Pseudonocardia sp. ICBG1293]